MSAISGTFSGNRGYGIYLSNPGSVSVTSSTIFGNAYGLDIEGSGGTIGDPVLGHNAGNIIHDNTNYGILADGTVSVAGNVVYDETGTNAYAIEVEAGASAIENVVYASQIGIIANEAVLISENRIYDNIQYGIDDINGNGATLTVSDNVIYSNAIGFIDQQYYSGNVLLQNNLIYANSTAAISIVGNTGVSIVNNTIDQPTATASISPTPTPPAISATTSSWSAPASRSTSPPTARPGSSATTTCSQLTNPLAGDVGEWQGVLRFTLGAWQAATSGDVDSFTGNPDFVNPTGAAGRPRLCQPRPARLRRRLPSAEPVRRFPRRQPRPDRRRVRQTGVSPPSSTAPTRCNRPPSTAAPPPIRSPMSRHRTAATSTMGNFGNTPRRRRKVPRSTSWC